MPLSAGNHIGRYQIVSLIGAGGMGEVYRARDAKLNRDVALKVLPDTFSADRDRLARFEREAQIVASLNHTNIAHVHGFEEVAGVSALAMELVDGPTLADRIAQGALPVAEALPIAKQIAEALEAAHEQGIVHRDLKPANIKLREDGIVKVLDFGLAKALDAGTGPPATSATMSPTLSMHATQAGIILGTAAYMSPEQAAGKPVDRRTDLWALGVVLLEMLTGRQVFAGETISHVLAAVLKDEPRLNELPDDTPEPIRRLLRNCLHKDRKRRLDSAAAARLEIEDALSPSAPVAALTERSGTTFRWLPWAVALVGLGVAGALAATLSTRPIETPALKTAFAIPTGEQLTGFAISPDGTRLVFSAANTEGRQLLFLRKLDDFVVMPIAGSEGGMWPFWSPDGQSVGFFTQDKLKKIDLAAGRAQTLCDARLPPFPAAAWSPNGTILFLTIRGALMRVPAAGGTPSPVVTKAGEENTGYGRPQFMPDGQRFLFFLDSPDAKIRGTYHSTLDRAERTKLTDVRTTFAPPDQLLLHFREGLQAQHLNVDTMQLTGEPRLLSYEAQAALSTSDNGVLIYRPLQSSGNYQMELVDRSAKRLSIVGKPGDLFMPRLSPDGRKVAVERHNDNAFGDIEIIDLSRDAVTRFTFNPTQHNAAASWSPSGDRLAFHTTGVQSGRGDAAASAPGLFVKPANGLAPEQLILESASPTDWTPSDVLVVERTSPNAGRRGSYDLWQVPLSGKREPSPLLNSPASEIHGRVSPNGRWLAYVSDEAGEREVYVTQFPPAGGKWQLSTGGGTTPVWRKDGSELFYLSLDGTLMAVPVRTERVFEHDTAIPLFKWAVRQLTANFWFYDAAQDGQQFIGVVPAGDRTRTELNVIVNWQR